ncbi:MAG: GNAT family N-acetyltransferase [Clostridia bacterium]|nr:GNAT family N-acetyltransferase [Clostridia bacterium]
MITREAFSKYLELSPNSNPDALFETFADIKKDIDTKVVLIAERDKVPVGSVRVQIDENTKTAYLSRFAVKISAQNNGIGKSLMNLVDEIMKKEDVKSISLHTDSTLAPLIRFYYGRGFYIDSVDHSKGYPRAHLVKKY